MAPVHSSSANEAPLGRRHDNIISFVKSLVRRMVPDVPPTVKRSPPPSPQEVYNMLTARSAPDNQFKPGEGAIPPTDINMKGIYALFAIICAAFVITGIWFFFWAKNGGFVWRKGDWEEYKSTVLRRKDSHGRTLSDVTKSTDLGGGSVVGRGFSDYTDGVTESSTVAGEKPKRKGFRETAKQKLLRKRKEQTWEGGHDDDMRAYRHEKPAKVGGINREADGTYHSSDYTGTYTQPSEYTESEVNANRTEAYYDNIVPRRQRDASGFSFAPGEDSVSNATEEHQLRDPSRTRHDRRPRGPRAGRHSTSPRKRERSTMPGGYTVPLDISSSTDGSAYKYEHVDEEASDGDVGTRSKSYHHPIPGLSKGYRRAADGRGRRRDSLSESEGDDYDSRIS